MSRSTRRPIRMTGSLPLAKSSSSVRVETPRYFAAAGRSRYRCVACSCVVLVILISLLSSTFCETRLLRARDPLRLPVRPPNIIPEKSSTYKVNMTLCQGPHLWKASVGRPPRGVERSRSEKLCLGPAGNRRSHTLQLQAGSGCRRRKQSDSTRNLIVFVSPPLPDRVSDRRRPRSGGPTTPNRRPPVQRPASPSWAAPTSVP